jgi:hypothetical protein
MVGNIYVLAFMLIFVCAAYVVEKRMAKKPGARPSPHNLGWYLGRTLLLWLVTALVHI